MARLTDKSKEVLRDSHFALKWVWIILMGFALKESVEAFLYDVDPQSGQKLLRYVEDYNWINVGIFLIFLITLVRFFHGSNRYLDSKYLEAHFNSFNPNDYRSGKRFFDLYFLLTQGIVFYFLGVSQRDPIKFFAIFAFGLLLLDGLWLAIVWLTTSERPLARQPRRWAINNLSHVFAFVVLFWAALPAYGEGPFQFWGLLLASSNCFVDYVWTWPYYFPKLECVTDVLPTGSASEAK